MSGQEEPQAEGETFETFDIAQIMEAIPHRYPMLLVDRMVDVVLGEDRDELGAELRRKWAWPREKFRDEHVFTDDWRGGRKGMILAEEMGPEGEIRVAQGNEGPEGKGSLY